MGCGADLRSPNSFHHQEIAFFLNFDFFYVCRSSSAKYFVFFQQKEPSSNGPPHSYLLLWTE